MRILVVGVCLVCALGNLRVQAELAQSLPGAREAAGDNADASSWELPPLPHMESGSFQGVYPETARRQGLEARVLLGFDITPGGHTKKVSVIWSGNPVFDSAAVEMVKGIRFTLPANWPTTNVSTRWRLGVVFRLEPSCQSDEFAIPVEKIIVTGSRLAGDLRCAPGAPSPK